MKYPVLLIVSIFFISVSAQAAQWLIDESPRKRTWESAIDYCDFKNGRLPTLKELKKAHSGPLKDAFKKDYYWSSSEYSNDFDQAYYFNFYNTQNYHSPKTFKMQVRCVKK